MDHFNSLDSRHPRKGRGGLKKGETGGGLCLPFVPTKEELRGQETSLALDISIHKRKAPLNYLLMGKIQNFGGVLIARPSAKLWESYDLVFEGLGKEKLFEWATTLRSLEGRGHRHALRGGGKGHKNGRERRFIYLWILVRDKSLLKKMKGTVDCTAYRIGLSGGNATKESTFVTSTPLPGRGVYRGRGVLGVQLFAGGMWLESSEGRFTLPCPSGEERPQRRGFKRRGCQNRVMLLEQSNSP